VGDEEVADVLAAYSCLFQLGKDTVPSTCIYKQHSIFAVKCEASVVATGGQGIAGTEHCYIVVSVLHKYRFI